MAIGASASTWTPGVWSWQRYLTKGDQRITDGSGTITVEPNFAAATNGYDTRTHAVRALEAIEATLERRAESDQLNFSIDTGNGARAVGRLTPAQLLVMRDRYRAEVEAERAAAQVEAGGGGSKILFRFTGA